MSQHELCLTRLIDAPPAALFEAWTEPELLQQWFTPRPWTAPVVETDVRPGGSILCLMRGPEGEEHPNHGVYLEVEQDKLLVFTDAYTAADMQAHEHMGFEVGWGKATDPLEALVRRR